MTPIYFPLTSFKLHRGVTVAIALFPAGPSAESSFRASVLRPLTTAVERTKLVDVLLLGHLEAFASQRCKFRFVSKIAIQNLLVFPKITDEHSYKINLTYMQLSIEFNTFYREPTDI